MMPLKFVKMHGTGNDFMLVEWPDGAAPPAADVVRRWADRRAGVGFDSLLVVYRGDGGRLADDSAPDHRASYRVFNADGSEAEQCGNGARCIASYLANGEAAELKLDSVAGPVTARAEPGGVVSVNLGVPDFRPEAVPFVADSRAGTGTGGGPGVAANALSDRYWLELESGAVELGIVSMGNPHAVIDVDSVDTAAVGIIGPELAVHPAFPEGVNVGFMQRESATRIRLRVFERGVGETLACGTGAAAAVAIGRRRGLLDERVDVELPGGRLTVDWPGEGADLWQTGQTSKVYEGLIEI